MIPLIDTPSFLIPLFSVVNFPFSFEIPEVIKFEDIIMRTVRLRTETLLPRQHLMNTHKT